MVSENEERIWGVISNRELAYKKIGLASSSEDNEKSMRRYFTLLKEVLKHFSTKPRELNEKNWFSKNTQVMGSPKKKKKVVPFVSKLFVE